MKPIDEMTQEEVREELRTHLRDEIDRLNDLVRSLDHSGCRDCATCTHMQRECLKQFRDRKRVN